MFQEADVEFKGIQRVQDSNVHHPVKIEGKGKRCKVCYSKFGPNCSISKILCQRCTDIYNKDIPLCIDCFSEFHSNPEKFLEGFKKQEEEKDDL